MTDSEQHPYVEWIASEARRPVVMDPGARDRIMAAVRAEPVPAPIPGWRRLLQPRVFHISPVGSALLAAGLVGIGVLTGVATSNPRGRASSRCRCFAFAAPGFFPRHHVQVRHHRASGGPSLVGRRLQRLGYVED